MSGKSRSRDRHRGYYVHRDQRTRDRGYSMRHNRYDGEDGQLLADSRQGERRRSRRRRDTPSRSRGYESRGYQDDDGCGDSHAGEEEEVYGYDYEVNHDRRYAFLPAQESRRLRPGTAEEELRRPTKAKESPATSPRKRGRDRDRKGRGRHRAYDINDGSPTKDVRERRHRRRGDQSGRRDHRREEGDTTDAEARLARRWEGEDAAAAAVRNKHQSTESTNSGSHLLSADALAKLSSQLDKEDRREQERAERQQRKRRQAIPMDVSSQGIAAGMLRRDKNGRVVSGTSLEKGGSHGMKMRWKRRGGSAKEEDRWRSEGKWTDGSELEEGRGFWKRRKWLWISTGVVVLLLAIAVPVAVVVSKKKNQPSAAPDPPSASSTSASGSSNLDGVSPDSIPPGARGTILDPFTWYETNGFNVTYTNETVGGLSIMGLNSTWDDSARPNPHVPPLNEPFPYGSQPIRGVNVGGWFEIEPFITPSLFDVYDLAQGVVDEWHLSIALGNEANMTIEKHYSTFITEQDFADIAAAGLDHVRIPYGYWAVTRYEGNPYVAQQSWRYLLRAIEWCRKYGLRVFLDLHGLPGSQNGFNNSGRQGWIDWINGTHGQLNWQRSLDIHDQLSQFFAQDRYKNIVAMYGLANEPLMLELPVDQVLEWTSEATTLVQKNGITAWVSFSDGFLNLNKWAYMLKNGTSDRMLLDTHQYMVFNDAEIALNHTAKIQLACSGWYDMIKTVNSTSQGWGQTICGEFSQADTDCAQYLNDVGKGTRWEGTLNPSNPTQLCPTAAQHTCQCSQANADPSAYSPEYKSFLLTYAEAQMSAFEQSLGWFYWTWTTESAAQWSYKAAWENGFMPQKAYAPSFRCGDPIPSFGSLPENY